MCNNGHDYRQLWTKYIVHIMLYKKHDKYSDNGKYRPNSSNNRPPMEPGVTPGPAGGERLSLPVPGIPAAVNPAPGTRAGWRVVVLPAPAILPRFSRGILPLPLPCKTLHCGMCCLSSFMVSQCSRSFTRITLVAYERACSVQAGSNYLQGQVLWSAGLPSRRPTWLPTYKNASTNVFTVTAPTMWNSLSVNTQSADSFAGFKRRLKSEPFASTYAT